MFHVERWKSREEASPRCEIPFVPRGTLWLATLSHLELFRGRGDVRRKCSTWNNSDFAGAKMFRFDFVPRGTSMLSTSSLSCLFPHQLLFHVEHEFKPALRPVKDLLQRGKLTASAKMLPGERY